MVFDMDGVLIDSEPIHHKGMSAILAHRDQTITDEEYAGLVGRTQEAAWDRIISRFGLAGDRRSYVDAYEAAVLDLLRGPLVAEPGAVELVTRFRDAGWKVALASSSSRPWVKATLERLELHESFDAIVSGDEVQHGKPDPEMFLLTARRLGVPSSRVLVIEDSLHGIQAARRAGMAVIGVRTRYTRGQVLPADRVVDSLLELNEIGEAERLLPVGGADT